MVGQVGENMTAQDSSVEHRMRVFITGMNEQVQ